MTIVHPVSLLQKARLKFGATRSSASWPDITESIRYQNLPMREQQDAARVMDIVLKNGVSNGFIDRTQVHRILDIAPGSGGSTFALKHVFKPKKGGLTAFEKKSINKDALEFILPAENIADEVGIVPFLSEAGRVFPKFNLINAVHPTGLHLALHQETTHNIDDFILAAKAALNPGGKLIFQPSSFDVLFAKKFCRRNGYLCQVIPTPEIHPDYAKETLVISFPA